MYISIATFSCKNNDHTKEAEKNVMEWIGKTVVFPSDVVCISMGRDTICPGLSVMPYKILVYTDSAGCTGCKLQLHKWNTLMKEADVEIKDKTSFHFYFHPKDERELKFLLKRDNFRHPVYMDREDKINKLNKLSSDMNYQCFLLDKDNKVVLIGNPVLNPAMWKLYKQVITGKKNEKSLITTASVETEQKEIELHNLKTGQTEEAAFILRNTGNAPFVIHDITTSCGCTVAEWDRKPVETGEKTKIKVKVTPKNGGYLRETITVFCNTEEQRLLLTVKGRAED